ncbi:MAG TPA: hypothetical protein VJ846_03580, partial [Sphingomicrobium sp.]|nr:hypothetical protein [Sphingomicrobium sp.]
MCRFIPDTWSTTLENASPSSCRFPADGYEPHDLFAPVDASGKKVRSVQSISVHFKVDHSRSASAMENMDAELQMPPPIIAQ